MSLASYQCSTPRPERVGPSLRETTYQGNDSSPPSYVAGQGVPSDFRTPHGCTPCRRPLLSENESAPKPKQATEDTEGTENTEAGLPSFFSVSSVSSVASIWRLMTAPVAE